MRAREWAREGEAAGRIEIFAYPAGPDAPSWPAWGGWAEETPAAEAGAEDKAAPDGAEAGLRGEFESKLAEEARRSFAAGRERGLVEGRQAEQAAQAAAQAASDQHHAQQIARLVEDFALERDCYLQAVEQEVVKLALAVAARILRREAQMDPLLLTGAVRVALGQLSASTQVRLLVPASELEMWTETIARLPNLAVKPAVIAGEGLCLGECRIETELGTVDLGLRAQLGEIERGFFDRAGGRGAQPAVAAGEAKGALQEIRP